MLRFLPLAAACMLACPAFPQGGAQFNITQNGKNLGQARFSVTQAGGAENWTSSGSMRLADFAYAFSSTAKTDAQGNLVRDELSGSVHGGKVAANDVHFDAESDATGRQVHITVNAAGVTTNNTVDRHQWMVLAPDLDPAAYTLMARVALHQPQTGWVLIPKESGILVPAMYTRSPDVTGTLNGRPTAARHTVAALGGEQALVIELYYTPQGELLEADLNAQNFRVERAGWRLANHPTPAPPPQGQAPEPPTQAAPPQQ